MTSNENSNRQPYRDLVINQFVTEDGLESLYHELVSAYQESDFNAFVSPNFY